MVSLTTTVGFRYGSGGHRVFLFILLTFSTLSYFTESKFADESRKKPASVHNYILTNALIFNRLHKKNPAFCVLAATKTGSACHRPCPDARCCVCSLQQETEAHVTGHVQMPDVVGARRYKNRKHRRARGLPYLREILRLLTDQPKKPRTFPNEKYSPWQ